MKEKITFISIDKKEFKTREECLEHEFLLLYPEIVNVSLFDLYGDKIEEYTTFKNRAYVYKVCVDNYASIGALRALDNVTKYKFYSTIDDLGVWTYNETDHKFHKCI